ncbi:MAG TPA: nucleotidyltransferase domain-containing protein [Candidatus Brocadiaceae bacterium]|nr:nucleotidyltransferase domain-containing protein [Candidatus Brocadiaceae bacterium]
MKITSDEIKERLQPVLKKYSDRVVFAYLFGSVAKGEATSVSDIDIAVFINPKFKDTFFDIRLSLYSEICRALNTNDVDVVLLNTAGNLMLLGDIIRNGVVIYDSAQDTREEYEVNTLHTSIDFKTQRFAVMGI